MSAYVRVPEGDQNRCGANFSRDRYHGSLGDSTVSIQRSMEGKFWAYVEVVLEGTGEVHQNQMHGKTSNTLTYPADLKQVPD